ncbi:PadR family transcriptional regulator PadR [Bradyrhizobium sp. AZCC 1719]|uniref:PadR family transcriptional regulator n=1 Tax=Bradyrhizobium sp. AZCC 1719 TaxID=3117028 RepID=UPI002FF1E43D
MFEAYMVRMARLPRPVKAIRSAPRPMLDYTDRAYWQGTIKMSLSKFFVLCVLHQKRMHGYEVVQAVQRTTKGCCSPTEGTVYPVLNEFEAGGYLTSHSEIVQGRERKVYTLTRKGREAFQTAVDAWLEATDCIIASKAAADAMNRSRGKAKYTC